MTIRKTFTIAAMAGLMLAYSGPVHAAEGWYVSANAGVSRLMDSAMTSAGVSNSGIFEGTPITSTGDFDFDSGLSITGALGYAWKDFRLEGELSYRKNDLGNFNGTVNAGDPIGITEPVNDGALDGDISALALMANVYHDFSTSSKWRPHVMVGIGGAKLKLNQAFEAKGLTLTGDLKESYDDSEYVFAYQAGAGIGYEVSEAMTVNLSYRFFGTQRLTLNDKEGTVVGGYKSNSIMLGVTFDL